MKNLLIFVLCAVISLTSCKNSEDKNSEQEFPKLGYNSYGEQIPAVNNLSALEMKEKFKSLIPGDTIDISFSTTVNTVCKNKGCWMTLDLPGTDDVMVKFKDYAFFVPKDIEEKEVVVNGKAYVAEVTVDEQRHYAEDNGSSAEEIAAITEPKKTYLFLAEGVLIKE